MNSTPWIVYLVLAGVSLVQAVLLALQAWEHRRYARSCLRDVAGQRPRGRAMILAPCKGAELALEENLRGLLRQDYDDYEITFIVEDAGDAAAAVIRRVLAEHPAAAARLLVAGLAAEGGQKVHNLRAATAAVPPAVRYLVFVDSDAQPRPEWLRSLLARLSASEAAVATRLSLVHALPPLAGAEDRLQRSTARSCRCLGRSSHYMVWGGSWAIRRDTFDSLGLHAAWKGTLSDDLVAARVLREARCQVSFQPACVVASPLDFSAVEAHPLHSPPVPHRPAVRRLLVAGGGGLGDAPHRRLVGHALSAIGCGLVRGAPSPWIPAALGAVLYGLGAYRAGSCRTWPAFTFPIAWTVAAGGSAFRRLGRPAGRAWSSGCVLLSTVLGRQIVWRGIRYRFLPRGRIKIVGRGGIVGETASGRSPAPLCPPVPIRQSPIPNP